MAPPQGVHVPLRFLRAMFKKGSSMIRTRILGETSKPIFKDLVPIYARIQQPPQSAASHIRQRVGRRWFTTRSFFNTLSSDAATAAKHGDKPRSPARPVTQAFRTATPFASTLRPSLHGGAMPRTAGGYALGGGARFFSHSPTAPAEVIQQVSQAVRGFILGGGGKYESYKRSDGSLGRLGVRALLAANLAQGNAPGAYVDFNLAPSFTALSPLNPFNSLENTEFMSSLSGDFGSMIAEITAVHGDMQRLSMLGDLPISVVAENGHTLRVHFPGCDRDFVETICAELGVKRGIVHEDERFSFGASLLDLGMKHVPIPRSVDWQDMLSESCSAWSDDGWNDHFVAKKPVEEESRSLDGQEYFSGSAEYLSSHGSEGMMRTPEEFEGLEGIYNFLYHPDITTSRTVRV